MIAAAAVSMYIMAQNGLRVRAEPSTQAEVVSVAPFGTHVEGIVEDGWLKAENGYMSVEWLSPDDPLADFTPMGEWRITAYYETGFATASGTYPEIGTTVAHNNLPFGTQIYVDGLGFWTVQDRGPSYLGSEWCDLYLGDYSECVRFGEQYRSVWIVPEGGGQDD